MVELETKPKVEGNEQVRDPKSKVKTKKKLNILLVCPLAVGETRLHPLTWRSIQDVIWEQPLDMLVMRDDAPDAPHMVNLTAKLNRARDIFLRGDYDAMWVVEADMIVPTHALQRLTRVKADVAYGVYCTRRMNHRWLTYAALEGNGEGPVAKPDEWGKAIETHGAGFGCTLIYRRVLDAFEFHAGSDGEGADWLLAKDLVANGYRQMHDFGVLCGHISRHDPVQVIWPVENAPYYTTVDPDKEARRALARDAQGGTYIARRAITSQTTGATIPIGSKIELSAALAANFLQRGIVDIYEGEI